MILKNTQITWKLKEGTVLKYGPAPDADAENKSSEVSVKSVPVTDFSHQREMSSVSQNPFPKGTADSVVIAPESTEETEAPSAAKDNTVISEKSEAHIDQAYPPSVNHHLENPANSSPVVDGLAVNTSKIVQPLGARWQSIPYRLRSKRADVFVDMQASVDYLQSLVDFLKNKGLDVKEYNDEVHYLPSDIILADASRLIDAGTVLVLQQGKRYIWDALLKEFGARLNG